MLASFLQQYTYLPPCLLSMGRVNLMRKNMQSRTEKKPGTGLCSWADAPGSLPQRNHRSHLKRYLNSFRAAPNSSHHHHSSNSCGLLEKILSWTKESSLGSFVIVKLLMKTWCCWRDTYQREIVLYCWWVGDISC